LSNIDNLLHSALAYERVRLFHGRPDGLAASEGLSGPHGNASKEPFTICLRLTRRPII
jgi:hypothetical protein